MGKRSRISNDASNLSDEIIMDKFNGRSKGFGFIEPDEGGKDVFVHISAVEQAGLRGLNEGQKIKFEVQENRGKEAATNLQVVED